MSTATDDAPVAYPYLRPRPTMTLRELADTFDPAVRSVEIEDGRAIKVSPDLTTIEVAGTETAYSVEAFDAIANWVEFPKKFLHRLDTDLQAQWMNTMLDRKRDKGVVRIGSKSGVISVLKPNQIPYDPKMVVDVAATVLGDTGSVIEVGNTPNAFWLDTTVSMRSRKDDLGDPQVGDITKAGMRFDMNTGQNLAPTVNPFYYRLWCSNGASSRHDATKLDARGLDVAEVMAELEAKARLAFSMVEAEVAAMYDLRNEVVANPERTVNRMAREQRIPDRTRLHIIESLPSMVPDANSVTMFDLVQVATHLANDPDISTRGGRLSLEHFGSAIITDHAERCQSCKAKLN